LKVLQKDLVGVRTGRASTSLLDTLRERLGFHNIAEMHKGVLWKMDIESENKKESGLTHLAKEVQELPGQKLEEIGKHRKQGSKNLEDVVKEVKKRPSKKKTAMKKTTRKKKK